MKETVRHRPLLAKTENWSDFTTLTWVLKSEDHGRFSVTQVAGQTGRNKPPIIFLPGMFSNRHFWMSRKGIGLAAFLAEHGHDCWLIERRAMGRSPSDSDGRKGLQETIQFDLPVVQRFVAEVSGGCPAFWMGHSFGGVAIGLSAANYLDQKQLAGLVLFASQFEVGKPSLRWPARFFLQSFSRVYGHFPSRRLGLGPENETVAAIDDACRWTTTGQKNSDLQNQLARISCPVLSMVGGADTVDPPRGCESFISHMSATDKAFICADKSNSFKEDYDHPGIVVSKSAREDVWPVVRDWVAARG